MLRIFSCELTTAEPDLRTPSEAQFYWNLMILILHAVLCGYTS
jgi:hypothetical protein